MPVSKAQYSFAGGQISSILRARHDTAKVQTGCALARNWLVDRFGVLVNRPGSQFITEVKDSTAPVRLVPFIFNNSQAYVLEFGNLYMRVIANGAYVTYGSLPTWGVGTHYAAGDNVTYLGLNYSAVVPSIAIAPPTSSAVWHPMTGAGNIYEIASPFTTAQIAAMNYVQSADVVTLVAAGIVPQQLSRLGLTDWFFHAVTLTLAALTPTITNVTAGTSPGTVPGTPTGVTAIGGLAGVPTTSYVVTAWQFLPGQEGITSAVTAPSVGHATIGQPVVLGWTAVAGADGYAVYKASSAPNTGGVYYLIAVVDTNAYTDNGDIPASPLRAANQTTPSAAIQYTYEVTSISDLLGSESLPSAPVSVNAGTPTDANPNVITWGAVAGSSTYNIYRVVNGVPGFIGRSTALTFSDTNIAPDFGIQPPVEANDPWNPSDLTTVPTVVAYVQQRLCFANSQAAPDTVWMSRVGDYHNFSISTPLTDADSIQFTLLTREPVLSMTEVAQTLIIETSGGEYTVAGDQNGVITPTAINLHQQGYNGANGLRPIVIQNTMLAVQARGWSINDLRYELQSNGYTGKDVTTFASDLVRNYTIVDWSYQKVPNSIVWLVRNDGTLLTLTYIREQEIWGWTYHNTNGTQFQDLYENVCCIPEGTEDAVYVVVRRTTHAGVLASRYIERFSSRQVTNQITNANFLDSYLRFDGYQQLSTGVVSPGCTMTLTGGTAWTTEFLTMTASAAAFANTAVGDCYELYSPAGSLLGSYVRVVVKAKTSATVITVQAQTAVPLGLQSEPTTYWAWAPQVVGGLSHLRDLQVGILGDGNVLTPATVDAGGNITLSTPSCQIIVGLSYVSDFQSLNLENLQGETILDKKKRILKATLIVESSRNIVAGPDAEHLNELRPLIPQVAGPLTDDEITDGQFAPATPVMLPGNPLSPPVPLASQNFEIRLPSTMSYEPHVFIRQAQPVPIALLAIIPAVDVGGTA